MASRCLSWFSALIGFAVCALFSVSFAGPLRAASFTWDGGATNDFWSAASNWNPDAAPNNTGTADLLFSGSVRLTPSADAAYSLNSIAFDGGAGSFALSGSALTLGAGGIVQNSPNAQTINNAITLGAAQEWTLSGGALTLGGGAAVNNGGYVLTISANNGASAALNGPISGAGGLSLAGVGAVTLGGANAYSGATSLNAGTLTFAAGSSLIGGGAINVGAGTTLNINGSINIGGNSLLLNGDSFSPAVAVLPGSGSLGAGSVTVGSSGSGSFTQSGGTTTLGNALVLGMNSASSGSYTLSGGAFNAVNEFIGYSGSGTFTQNGGANTLRSTLFLSAGSGGNGSYTLTGGTLEIASMVRGSGAGTFYFNGGTLRTNMDTPTFMGGLTAAYVQGGGAYIDSNGHNITVAQPLLNSISGTIGGLNKLGGGALTLTGANTYQGATAIYSGTLTVTGSLNGSAGTGLTLYQGGVFNAAEAANRTQGMGALAFTSGGGTVQSTYPGSGNTSLNFASLASRPAGATGNLAVNGGVNGSTNRITLGGVTAGFINPGMFFGGSNYAWENTTGGYVRGIDYTFDAGAVTANGAPSFSGTYVQTTGAVTAQTTTAFTTLNLSGNNAFTLASGATLTVSGILKSGNAAGGATISGGVGIQAPGGAELIIRTDGVNDALTINTPIALNGSSSLTKTGAGTLTLNKTNPYTGTTTLTAGTLTVTATGSLIGGGAIYVYGGATLNVNGIVGIGSSGVSGFSGNQLAMYGSDSNPSIVNLNSGGTLRLANEYISNGASGSFTQSGGSNVPTFFYLGFFSDVSGSYTLNGGTFTGSNEYIGYSSGGTFLQSGGTNTVGNVLYLGVSTGGSGSYTLSGGTLQVPGIIQGSGSGTFNFNGGLLQATTGSTAFMGGLTAACVQAGGAKIDSNTRNIIISQPLLHDPALGATADGGLTKSGVGTLTLTGANTFTGNTTVSAGTLAVGGVINNNGTAQVSSGATLEVSDGGSVSAGQINNAGRLRLKGSAALAASGTINNTGTLDLINWSGTLPANFANGAGGTIIDAGSVRITGVSQSGAAVKVNVQAYAGHTYVLQGSASLNPASWSNVSPAQSTTPTADGTLTFTHTPASSATQQFYRVLINP